VAKKAPSAVYFYHTDPAGTPMVMTNMSRSVVWRADYRPFGEEQSITGLIENNEKFTGKEKDKETGFYYFGARYMRPEIGRFAVVDPIGIAEENLVNPQKLNRYSYGLNNPYRYIDPDGKWPEEVHNTIISRAFSGGKYILSTNAMSALMSGSKRADSNQYQDLAHSYMHAMRASGQSPQDAERMMNDFIKEKMREYKTLLSQGNEDKAYESLGMAMHPLMDATSPSHEGFREWLGVLPVIPNTIKASQHGWNEREDIFNSNTDYSRRSVESIRKFYNEAIK
jgi:RHS repeat-associated protein